VSPALFSTALHTRTAQKALARDRGSSSSGSVGPSLDAIAELTRGAQTEMRALILELRRDPVHDGLVAALARHVSSVPTDGLTIHVRGPGPRLPLSQLVETQLFAIAREALANVQRHAGASAAHVRVEAQPEHVVVEVRDNGRGFDPAAGHRGHFGLESMRSRAAEIGGRLTITSAPGSGTLVRVRAPVETDSA
jgi:signal transduction histidine kinase